MFDIVVVGAGPAGIAAARAAAAAGAAVQVLEARSRIGGRTFTTEIGGIPVDLGAHWLHSADENPLAREAERLGVTLERRSSRRRFVVDGAIAPPPLEAELAAAIDAAEATIIDAGRDGDGAVAAVLPSNPVAAPFVDWWVRAYTSVEPAAASTGDWARYRDTGCNWMPREGYGTLVARLAEGLPVRCDCPVTRIRAGASRVVCEMPAGAVEARACILAVPPPRLVEIAFEPGLDPATLVAAADLPLGCADRIVLVFRGDPFGGMERCALRWPDIGFQLRPFDQPMAVGFVGGAPAAALEAEGEAATVAFALDRLAEVFGSDLRRALVAGRASAWGRERWIGGGYSAARPGKAHVRGILARPAAERLFVAGEATSPEFFTTVHGAWLSGERAAREAQAAIGLTGRTG